MYRVYERVVNWNATRYERKYNKVLMVELLAEELEEWLEADNATAKLDALCDIVYVAMGAMWKEGSHPKNSDTGEAFSFACSLADCADVEPANYVAAMLSAHLNGAPAMLVTNRIIALAILQMYSMGLSFEDTIEAMLIVCDANDSKTIQKTASDTKANKDKGEFFRSPEPRLKELLCKVKK